MKEYRVTVRQIGGETWDELATEFESIEEARTYFPYADDAVYRVEQREVTEWEPVNE